jgi:hypothetical protein
MSNNFDRTNLNLTESHKNSLNGYAADRNVGKHATPQSILCDK